MKKIIVGLFGIALESVNFGVTALAFTQIQMLRRIKQELGCELEYWLFSDDSDCAADHIKSGDGRDDIKIKYIVRIRTGFAGLKKLNEDIKRCDLIIDLTYGDSFSDIYGIKNFYLYSLPKFISIKNKRRLIMGPQTIGPFYKKSVQIAARYILKKAYQVVTRDSLSLEYAKRMTGRNDILLTSDLAMNLSYETSSCEYRIKGKLNIGLNVSLLMWKNDSENSKLNVKLPYKELVMRLLEKLKERDIAVHLIVHVYNKKGFTEYTLAEELHQQYAYTVLAPKFQNPIQAKNYMSGLDCFIGSRMHATIGAFSAGVPVIPVSYSRKFEGLYGTLGYDHCIDCSRETVSSAIKKIMDKLMNLELLRKEQKEALLKAKSMNEAYYEFLRASIEALL